MTNKVYIFNIRNAFTFFKAGQFLVTDTWIHKDIVNQGDYEFIMMIEGSLYLELEGEQITLNKHECLVIPPYTRHFGFKKSEPGATHYWMHFFPSGPVSFANEYQIGSHHDEKDYHLIQIPQHFKIPEFEKIVILSKQLLDGANDRHNSPLTTNFIVTSIAIELANQALKQQRSQEKKVPSRFETINQWIKLQSHTDISVQTVADQFGITPVYLNRLFKKYRGLTTSQFISQTKINQAEELLLTTDWSIKEIALELSFSNEKYFMRVFKQHHGLTPTEFRNSFPQTYMNTNAVDPTLPRPNQMM